VSLKLTKLRTALPSRKAVEREKEAKRFLFSNSVVSSLPPFKGPLLPNGEFLSQKSYSSKIKDLGVRYPTKRDWEPKVPLSKTEPFFVKACHLSPKETFLLTRRPSKAARKEVRQGKYEVYPNRYCVQNFKRRMVAMDYLFECFKHFSDWTSYMDFTKAIKECNRLLPEIFSNLSVGSHAYRKATSTFGYFRRKFTGQAQFLKGME